jgi:hypothetical protein
LIITWDKKKKISRLGSLAGGAPFGRLLLQLNRTAERKAASAADQVPLSLIEDIFNREYNFNLALIYDKNQ